MTINDLLQKETDNKFASMLMPVGSFNHFLSVYDMMDASHFIPGFLVYVGASDYLSRLMNFSDGDFPNGLLPDGVQLDKLHNPTPSLSIDERIVVANKLPDKMLYSFSLLASAYLIDEFSSESSSSTPLRELLVYVNNKNNKVPNLPYSRDILTENTLSNLKSFMRGIGGLDFKRILEGKILRETQMRHFRYLAEKSHKRLPKGQFVTI